MVYRQNPRFDFTSVLCSITGLRVSLWALLEISRVQPDADWPLAHYFAGFSLATGV
jgi:hypothetical protein